MDGTDIIERPNFCEACAIRNRAICADLDNQEIDLLNKIGRRRQLQVGEQLLWEGDEAVLVANVVEGVLKLSTATADGREQIVGLVYSSDFVGRPFSETTPYGVEALTDATVCVFRRKDFDRFALDHPRLANKLLERTLTELDRSRRWILLLGKLNAEERVASFLIEVGRRLEVDVDQPANLSGRSEFSLPLSRQQIADILGLTIETVSRQFTRFKKDGIIQMPTSRTIIVPDIKALINRAG
ncbi:CRP/FNR family transcriptional regulator, anaerobic regulatory protein [Aurantiacibacter atlanticus]|uniref:CRP/FNR family transcriptional regulator, anaerobic regulatory protein n=1 Tax=Aurantiacibacter atlanticus TaxID=1648404 RepID=A0A0H4W019_9SPHN|nr:Crp/Fnr family transcriptional regulator [Aurantiacibacter atlanticus]AKQ42798.1 CRP/FNR family transcriptional regulator, anaerobic regulatory protein [Aurantiacibacter atlanticus]MDF1835029.1 Crp/Fnr family transcriptional regulator [Alteraurantiacibacter sp. bin_em_oilr2.035]